MCAEDRGMSLVARPAECSGGRRSISRTADPDPREEGRVVAEGLPRVFEIRCLPGIEDFEASGFAFAIEQIVEHGPVLVRRAPSASVTEVEASDEGVEQH